MQQTDDETRSTNNEQQIPSTGRVAKKARLEAVIPTALVGPAGAPLALEHRATLVLTPVTNESEREETGAHEHPSTAAEEAAQEPIAPPPPAAPGQKSGYPVITTPIPMPGDLSHTTPFPSSPVQHQAQQWSPRHQRLFLVGLGSGLLLYLLALVLVAVFIAPVVTLAATVTLTPEVKTLSTALTVTVLPTGTPDPTHEQVNGRLLSVSSSTQSQTVPTTGTGHAPARVGEGTVTLYNAAPYSQTVAAGTLLTGANGVEIVTAAPAVIPAGNPPIEGEVTVPAYATVIGPQGNIAPLDLNGLCCMAGISVKNTAAFHGGQYAYDYPMVTQVDIDHAAGPLLATLTPETQASLQAEVHPNERFAGQGVWVYQVRTAEQARLSRLIAGLSRQAAIQVVQQQEAGHLAAVHIQISGLWASGTTLPTDLARIHLIVTMGG